MNILFGKDGSGNYGKYDPDVDSFWRLGECI